MRSHGEDWLVRPEARADAVAFTSFDSKNVSHGRELGSELAKCRVGHLRTDSKFEPVLGDGQFCPDPFGVIKVKLNIECMRHVDTGDTSLTTSLYIPLSVIV